MTAQRIVSVLALLAVLAGAALNALSLLQADETALRLRGKARDLQSVRALAAEAAAARAQLQAFEALRAAAPADLREMLARVAPGLEGEIRPREPEAVLPGWELHGVDVTLPEAPLAQAGEFMLQAETSRPPWRVSACVIQATAREGGRGRVTIALECLRPGKAQPAARGGVAL